ncbi:MAG TPA: GAF domain-containing sensor histidine kinase [Longimicrobiales bacterium]|nr:GAF domain-containing sensor histidine kinase [Longimicrobiales bacterium]
MAERRGEADRNLRRLTQVSRALTYARSLDQVLELTLDCAVDLLACDKAVLMMNDEDGLLGVQAQRGIDPDKVERFREPLDETILDRLSDLLGPDAKDRFLGVPLVVGGNVTGLLAVRRPRSTSVQDRDEWLLSALADQVAVALASARHRDLDERVRTLEARASSKEHALRVISHDVRSPLNAILGYLELLSMGSLGDLNEDQTRTVERIKAVTRHLGSVMKNVGEEARFAGGEAPLHLEEADIGKLIGDAVAVVQPPAAAADTTLAYDAPDGLHAIVDPDRTRQIVVQLLENAVKHCPEGSTVEVRARPARLAGRPAVEIAVADDGPGIPPERQAEVFEPYQSFPVRSEDGHSGFGLGLSIVRTLVERMHGEVRLESVPGEGATFVVTLPSEASSDETAAEEAPAARA